MKLNKKLKLVKSLEKQSKKLKKASDKLRDDIKIKEGDVFEHVNEDNEQILIKVVKGGGCDDCYFNPHGAWGGCTFEYCDKCDEMSDLVFTEER